MYKQKSGVIINMSSVSSKFALAGQAVYSATKGAVNSLTQTLAKELGGFGIRVNAVAPGFIATEMIEAIPEETRAGYLEKIPLKRFGSADEVANIVSALASDQFAYVTGQVFVLDGGLSL
jgi:3-oxoacyl-[acyl-carrier protein] reductase